jgi:hypothetical protein
MPKSIEISPQKHLANLERESDKSESSSSAQATSSASSSSTINASEPSGSSKVDSMYQTEITSNRKLTILRRINLFDEKNRPLFLIARIIFKIGSNQNAAGSRRVSNSSTDSSSSYATNNSSQSLRSCPVILQISAVYCFFNLTGLPLVFRQYNSDEAAGQSEEHEFASSNQPLLFSFNEIDSPYACSMRVGKQCKDFRRFLDDHDPHLTFSTNSIVPKWCKPFGLDSGSSFRPLYVVNNVISDSTMNSSSSLANTSGLNLSSSSLNNYSNTTTTAGNNHNTSNSSSTSYLNPDWVYYIGIEIKTGKGLLKDTTFVYFSTRYYLVNRATRDLCLSQFHFVKGIREQSVAGLTWNNSRSNKNSRGIENDAFIKTFNSTFSRIASSVNSLTSNSLKQKELEHSVLLVKNSMSQFHWPRADFDQLLSVKVKDEEGKSPNAYNWSGGFKVDTVDSFYIGMRHVTNAWEHFYLKVDVVLDGGTFYIVFTDRCDHPFPLRVENYSQVPLYVYQAHSLEEKYNMQLRPNNHVLNYSWDEPIAEKKLIVGVKGGTSTSFDLNQLADNSTVKYLFYENYVYIVFTASNDPLPLVMNREANYQLNQLELVLTCVNNKVSTFWFVLIQTYLYTYDNC